MQDKRELSNKDLTVMMRRADIPPRLREEFLRTIEFHTYPAPGLLIGVFMVDHAFDLIEAKRGEKLYAVSETSKCAPDPLQVIAHCTAGNHRLRVIPYGRFAITLNRPSDGPLAEGVRVFLDPRKLAAFPLILRWFMNDPLFKPGTDMALLLQEIFSAGRNILSSEGVKVQVHPRQKWHQAQCRCCGEMVPEDLLKDGMCTGCSPAAYYKKYRNE
jgi:formylmethanofuran dehydrogenase subunit E